MWVKRRLICDCIVCLCHKNVLHVKQKHFAGGYQVNPTNYLSWCCCFHVAIYILFHFFFFFFFFFFRFNLFFVSKNAVS